MATDCDASQSSINSSSNASLPKTTSSKFLDWKKIKECDSPTSVIGEEVTHDELRIIGTENIKSFFNVKHAYGTKLTKRKHVTYKQNVMLCYCLGNKNKSLCAKKRNWVRTKGKLIVNPPMSIWTRASQYQEAHFPRNCTGLQFLILIILI